MTNDESDLNIYTNLKVSIGKSWPKIKFLIYLLLMDQLNILRKKKCYYKLYE